MRTASTVPKPVVRTRSSHWKLSIYAILILVCAEAIGAMTFRIGRGQVVFLPMIWAVILGALAGCIQKNMGPLALTRPLQFRAAVMLQPALLLVVAKLGLMVGSLLPRIVDMGWGFVFQQLGHVLGTVVIGLPLALLLGLKREAIGATFSAGRESSLAIIGERYGMNSPEGRGVLSEYLTGTMFGAVFIAVFAGFVASLHIFHPLALAMGAGIGSGSMMAAAAGAIAALQTPQLAQEVVGFAAASNLLNAMVGTYCMLFISLPLAAWGYRVLEPVIGRFAVPPTVQDAPEVQPDIAELDLSGRVGAYLFVGVLTILANWIGYRMSPLESAVCIAMMIATVFVGEVLHKLSGKRVSTVCLVTLGAMFLTSPACPWAAAIAEAAGKVSVLALMTPMLTLAGLSVAKDLPVFRKLGWRIVLTSLAAYAGTFICATVIAEFFY